jgi:hypothetical protein
MNARALAASASCALAMLASTDALADTPRDFVSNTPLMSVQGLRSLSLGGDEATLGNMAALSDRSGTFAFTAGHYGDARTDFTGSNGGSLATASVVTPRFGRNEWALRATFTTFDAVGAPTIETTDPQPTAAVTRSAFVEACARVDEIRFGVLAGYAGSEATLQRAGRAVEAHLDYDALPLGAGVLWSPFADVSLGARIVWMSVAQKRTPTPDDRSQSIAQATGGLAWRPSPDFMIDFGVRDWIDENGGRVSVSCGAEVLLADSVRLDAGVRGSTFTIGLGMPVGDALVELMLLDRDGSRGEQAWVGERAIGVFGAITFRYERSPHFATPLHATAI